ncbi:hypothetical protein ACQ4PT_057401 [Festuca glaucescens]
MTETTGARLRKYIPGLPLLALCTRTPRRALNPRPVSQALVSLDSRHYSDHSPVQRQRRHSRRTEKMTKPDRTRDDGLEIERAVKKRSVQCVHPDIGASPQAAEVVEAVISSYTLSSPLRKPYIPDELADPTAHPEILAAFEQAKAQYEAKLGALNDLCHFDCTGDWDPSSMFPGPQLLPIHDLAKVAVLRAAKSIALTELIFADEKALNNCCGLWIDWNEKSKTGVVLTTAHIIRTKHPTVNHWKGRDEYNSKASASVHLRNGTTAEGRLLYHQEHSMILLSLRVELLNPNKYERHHYMYFYHEDPNYKCKDDGGSIIGLDGKVVGLVNDHLKDSFVPSSILVKSIDLWRKFGCIPRLHLGMKFSSIKLLDTTHIEKMGRKYNIEEGLIVEEVSKESHAEKQGIHIGDIVECFNGQYIYTTIELEKMLMDRCKDHFEEGNALNAKIDISIQVFDTVKLLRRTANLTTNISDCGEVVDGSSSMVEANGARVDEMTKEEEDLSSFTPKSPISKPYIPDELNDPTVYPEVTVHLRDGTTAEGHYLYHQEHYDLAFFKVRVDEPVQLPSFNGSVHCGQDVFRLGRDQSMDLRITHGRVEYWNPASIERYHYMYFLHEHDDCLCDDDGGAVIDLDGKVVGLINNHLSASFVPSSILDNCVDLWRKFGCIPRLHLGMKFDSIRLLDPINVERMWRMHNIEEGLIVEKVSKESHAEKLGIFFGDIIECFNGEHIYTTIELENMLLGRCKDHFNQGKKLNAKIDVSIQVFHTDERVRRTINLNVEVSDHGEVIRESTYPITATLGTSAAVQSNQNVAGK